MVILASACSSPSTPAPASPDIIAAPTADYFDVTWLGDGTIVALSERWTSGGFDSSLVAIRDGEADPIHVESVSGCDDTIQGIASLSDGRLTFTVECNVVDPPHVPVSVRVLDLASGSSEELVRLPSGANGGYAFAPDLDRGLFAESAGICATMGAIEDGRAVPSEIVVVDGDNDFPVSDAFRERPPDCADYINAHRPAWSPDGEHIAFFASVEVRGRTGTDRLGARWNLYVIAADEERAEPVLTGIDSPFAPSWSPDSTTIAFSSDGFQGSAGTWLYSMTGGSVRLVSTAVITSLSWSPDGDEILGLQTLGLDGPTRIVTIEAVA